MECSAVVLTLLSSSCNSFGCLPATWNCHKVTISQCVPSAKGSLVILIPVSSKFPFVPASPDLVSQSFCYFTTICKLEPLAFTWNVRLVPIWKCQPLPSVRHRCWRNHPGERGNKGLVTWYWHWLHHELHVDIMAAQISHALLWGQRTSLESSAGPGTAITRIVWALAWRLENASGAQYLWSPQTHDKTKQLSAPTWLWTCYLSWARLKV